MKLHFHVKIMHKNHFYNGGSSMLLIYQMAALNLHNTNVTFSLHNSPTNIRYY